MIPMVSVIMPVYNEEKYLQRSIESILQQTYKNFELLIINEADSKDRSIEIVEAYMKKDKRIKLFQKRIEKKGIAVSLNIGINLAQGEYIARMDADDYAYADRLEKQVEYMEKNKEIILCGTGIKLVTPNGNIDIRWRSDPEEIRVKLLFESQFVHPTVIFRRGFFLENDLLYDENDRAEDYALWIKAVERGKTTNLDDILLEYYRGFGNNISSIENKGFQSDVCRIKKEQLWNKLNIQSKTYGEALFYPGKELRATENKKEFIAEMFILLSDIEKQNDKLKVFDKKVLGKVLSEQWNLALKNFYLVGHGDESFFLPFLCEVPRSSFQEELANKMGIKLEEQIKTIQLKVKKAVLQAGDLGRIVIFGAGQITRSFLSQTWISAVNIVGICDTYLSADQRNELITEYQIPIVKVENLTELNFDTVLIGSDKYYDDIYLQLQKKEELLDKKIVSIKILRFLKFDKY